MKAGKCIRLPEQIGQVPFYVYFSTCALNLTEKLCKTTQHGENTPNEPPSGSKPMQSYATL